MKKQKTMKKIILSVTGTLLLMAVISLTMVSCNKEEIEKNNSELNSPTSSITEVDFSSYYEAAETLAQQFWTACDMAYQKTPEAFVQACKNNDFKTFQQLTNLDSDYFEQFKAVLLQAQTEIEADYPGISMRYQESPCTECVENALPRIGHFVDTLQGNSAANVEKLNNRDCWFVCSLSCMATMELYIPCVLSCVKICKKYMQNW